MQENAKFRGMIFENSQRSLRGLVERYQKADLTQDTPLSAKAVQLYTCSITERLRMDTSITKIKSR
jgi:hypothetical protein